MSTKHLVFSYGTLKRGEPNNFVMTEPENGIATFVGKGCTSLAYPLVVASDYGIPFLLLVEGEGNKVQGEVYEVDDKMLGVLDKFESHPDFYRREEALINMTTDAKDQTLESQASQKCWIYFLPKYKPEMLNLPRMESYTSASKDHLPYVERYNRKGTIRAQVLPD